MKKKYLSRKFIVTVITTVGGVATALSGVGGKVGVTCGLVAALCGSLAYVIVEGKIDKAALGKIISEVKEITEEIGK